MTAQRPPKVEAALKDVATFGPRTMPTGVDRAALSQAAVVLAPYAVELEHDLERARAGCGAPKPCPCCADARTALAELTNRFQVVCAKHAALVVAKSKPIPLVMFCPAGHPHVDEGEWATKPHKTHQCQEEVVIGRFPEQDGHGFIERYGTCGLEWRPADFPTVGVK